MSHDTDTLNRDTSGLRGVKSNLRRFLRRIGGESVGSSRFQSDPAERPSAGALLGSIPHMPGGTEIADPELDRPIEPDPDPDLDREAADREHDEATLQAWREELASRLLEREQRRRRAAPRLAESHQRIDALIARMEEIKDEATDAAVTTEKADHPPEASPDTPTHPAEAPNPPQSFDESDLASYAPPSPDFLRNADLANQSFVDAETLEAQKARLQETFDNFMVDAFVCDALVGPRVTQYRVKPGYGVKVDAIASLDRNIALALAVKAVRIQAPIPGEPFVGVEIPNPKSLTIRLRSAFDAPEWRNSNADIPLVMGMDMGGRIIITDLAKAPHMLVAGATGSGKSVCINNFLLSMLYRFRPDELELVLVDPKRVEFALFKDIPHLIHPVVTDPKVACGALKWLVREMERRYEELATKRVRNLAGYNARAGSEGFRKMPYIVLVIDEMADLMMTAREDIETPIARLAQMSRAVGIHTVLATQRPSVNVITGVIKANYPSRVAFMVSSVVDSRTILDSKGAETLQGQGDMLFNPPGLARLLRLQSPFVEDAEILAVTDYLRSTLPPRYRAEFTLDENDTLDATGEDGESDPLLRDCIQIITTARRASTSLLQRKLKIGYNRAATLMEELEARGYVGPQIGQNPREVFAEPTTF